MPNLECTCCKTAMEKHLAVFCCVCKKPYKATCVGLSQAEVRSINAKNKSLSWNCTNCNVLGQDINDLKAVILNIQTELHELKSNNTQFNLMNANFEEILQEFEERQNRKSNLIIFGVPEQNSDVDRTTRIDNERRQISEIINQVSPNTAVPTEHKIIRLGKFIATNVKPRPIRVRLANESSVHDVIHKLKSAKINNKNLSQIYISFHRTPKQLEHLKSLKLELKQRQDRADSTSQYDAIRAYLKELDITENVWLGLSKTSERPNFSWTNFQTLSGDGHWQEPIPKSSSPICVAMDPAADFLWKSLPCGGPEVASFICELSIPSWALGPRGCLLTELPSLTVLYIPEQSAVELTSDCGLDGTKRIACKGNADREEILKQLTCAISHEDFDEKSTKAPIASSTVYETSSDENSVSGKTTKTWIWTSNTVDIDYGMPTRHRRETEDTLSPISTKSTAGISATKESYQKKLTATEHFTTSATNYDTEVTTNSLENYSTLDSTISKIPNKSTRLMETKEGLTTQDINSQPEEQAETFSTAATASITELKISETAVEGSAVEYPSAINQGQLFSIIENGTMFDIIELNDTNSNSESKRAPDMTSSTQENKENNITTIPTQVSNNESSKEQTGRILNTLTETEKQRKKEISKYSEPKIFSNKILSKGSLESDKTQGITKEIELFPIIKDSSIKLNRTFRKDVPPLSDESQLINNDKVDKSRLNLSVNNYLSNPVHEYIEIKYQGHGTDNITEKLFIATSTLNTFEKPKSGLPSNVHIKDENMNVNINRETLSNETLAEIDPKIDILNLNLTRNNDSETIDSSILNKDNQIPENTLSTVIKQKYLPKSLLGEITSTSTTAEIAKDEESKPAQDPLATEPQGQPRPNRQRQLTRPQRRSFYPYLFSRVLG